MIEWSIFLAGCMVGVAICQVILFIIMRKK
jgi:hypothetical protein